MTEEVENNCISVPKRVDELKAGDCVKVEGRDFDDLIALTPRPNGFRLLRFRDYQLSLPPNRVVATY